MSTTVPNEQYMAALERANKIRKHRAEVKRDLKAGKTLAQTLITAPGENVLTMRVFDVLLAMPKTGRVKANKILRRCNVSPSKTLAGLSERQRLELLALLPARVAA